MSRERERRGRGGMYGAGEEARGEFELGWKEEEKESKWWSFRPLSCCSAAFGLP
jgi:hypothetical protein